MAHRKNKIPIKTFQQRQTEKYQREAHDRAVVEDIASRFSCSHGVAHEFEGQCAERIRELDLDLIYSKLALAFWADPPEAARPVVEVLRELEAEHQRYMVALGQLHERLLELTRSEAAHQHLTVPLAHYQEMIRDGLFRAITLQPGQNPAASGER